MKKQKNATRIIAIVLVALMALALIPIAASADGPESVTLYRNDGSTGEGISVTRPEGDNHTLSLPDGWAHKDSATAAFLGWSTTPTGEEDDAEIYQVTDTVESLPSTVTELYALWEMVTVTFDSNGGSEAPAPQTVAAGADVNLPSPGTKEGYTFTGWKVGTGATLDPEATSFTPDASVTLTAQWTAQHTVSFDPKGGSVTPTQKTVTEGGKYGELPTPTRTGYIFGGWFLGEDQISAGTDAPTEDVTLVAHWSDDMVAVEYDRGTEGTGTTPYTATSVRRGDSFKIKTYTECGFSIPSTSTKVFKEWTYNGSEYQAGDYFDIPGNSSMTKITFVASYATACKVTFEENGGSSVPDWENVAQGTVKKLPEPTKSNYTLEGWYSNSSFTAASRVGAGGENYTVNDLEKTLFAHWLSNNVTFKFEHGDGATGTKADVSVTRGDTYTAPTTCTEFTKTNYVFVGWKDKADNSDFTSLVTGNDTPDTVTLVAQWKLDAVEVTLTDGTTTKTTTMYRSQAEQLTALSETGISKPAGSVFLGWAKTSGATEAVFADKESVRWNGTAETDKNYAPDSGEVTLYAVFEQKLTGDVTIKKDGTPLSEGNLPKVNDPLTAEINPAPASGTLYYQWKLNGDPVDGANAQTFTVPPDAYGKNVSVDVTNDPEFSYARSSGAYKVGADPSALSTVTVHFTKDPAATEITGYSVTVADEAGMLDGYSTTVPQGGTMTVTLVPGTNTTAKVKTLELSWTEGGTGHKVTRTGDAVAMVNTFTVPDVDACDLTVTFSPRGGTPGHETATLDPSEDVSAITSAITTKAKATLPAGQKDRYKVGAVGVVPCWDNELSNPLAEIPEGGLNFTLPYPAGSDFNATVKANMPKYYNITVYHGNGATVITNVEPQAAFANGVEVKGQKDFSPFGVSVTPVELEGTLKLDASAAYVGTQINATYSDIKNVQGTPKYQWQIGDAEDGPWTDLATGQSYTPKAADKGKYLRCVFTTTDFETGSVASSAVKVGAIPKPVWQRDIVNNGGVQTGLVKNVTSDMVWSGPSSTKPGTSATWHSITGTTFPVTEQGYYWVRFANDTSNTNVSDPVFVANYFTVKCHPDSVSTNRLYFEATTSGTSAEVHSGQLSSHPDVIYDNNNSDHYWIKEKGKGITVYAKTSNSKYYKITAIKAIPTETSSFSKTGKSDSLSVTIGSSYAVQPYDVWASAGVYGSKTGDTSHLELWVELAALSLMGLGAALVLGRRKLKAQK